MRITITINDELSRVLKTRVAETDVNISQYIKDAIKHQHPEDFKDTEDTVKRINEPAHLFDELVAQFKAEGLL